MDKQRHFDILVANGNQQYAALYCVAKNMDAFEGESYSDYINWITARHAEFKHYMQHEPRHITPEYTALFKAWLKEKVLGVRVEDQ